MDEHLPTVLCQLTISYFDDFEDIDNLLKITKNTKYILESYIYVKVSPNNEYDFIEKYNKFYKLINVNFLDDNYYVTNKFIRNKLTNVHTLILGAHSKITNNGLQYLTNIRTLNLGSYSKITDNGLKYLTNVNTLILGSYSKITNDGLQYLTNVRTLNLGSYSKITDEGLKYLTNINVLDLGWRSLITDEGLKYLANARLEISTIYNSRVINSEASRIAHGTAGFVGDSAFISIGSFSEGINTLILGWGSKITDKGLQYLTSVHTLDLGSYSKITNEGLKYLTNVRTLKLGYGSPITDEELQQLKCTIINRYKYDSE
jgi:hypothetical protein